MKTVSPMMRAARAVSVGLLLSLSPCAAVSQRWSPPADTDLRLLADVSSNPSLPEAPQTPALSGAASDSSSSAASPNGNGDGPTLLGTPKRIVLDELHVVTSPARLRAHDLRWLLPVAVASAAAFSTDSYTMRNVVSTNPGFNNTGQNSSNILLGVAIAAPAVLFSLGEFAHKEHARETGLLAGEAMVDAIVLDEGVKYITLRERPMIDNANGTFFSGNAVSSPSFFSGHSTVAWSSAAVLAAEYSKPWQQAGIYTLASGVSLTRVLGQEHFPSDVLLGAVSGWLIGHYVYRAHHKALRGTP